MALRSSARSIAVPPPISQTFSAKAAAPIAFTSVQSNLAASGHYINFSVTFSVMKANLVARGGLAGSSSGTGNADLDAQIQNALLNLARSTSYQELTQTGGESVFKQGVSVALQSIFGPGSIGNIYFPTFLLQ